MKKTLLVFLAISAVMSMTSYHRKPSYGEVSISTSTADALSQIFEIGGSYEDDSLNHKNVISNNVIHTTEKIADEQATIQVAGQDWNLSYEETITYRVGDYKVNQYRVGDSEDSSVLLHEDGSVVALLNTSMIKINILPNDTPETVRAALQPAVAEFVDLSKYQNMKVDRSIDENEERFDYYYLILYNTIEGYIGDYTAILVNDDGTVTCLWIKDIAADSDQFEFHIDNDLEEELILAKTMSLLDGLDFEYRSHRVITTPSVVSFNNELCVQYCVGIHFCEKGSDHETSFAIDILIPVRLLSGAETAD